MVRTITATVPYNAEIAYKAFVYGVKIDLPKIDQDGQFIHFEFLADKVMVVFYYFQSKNLRRAYIISCDENNKGKQILLPGFNKPVRLIYMARGRAFYNLRRWLMFLTMENPFRIFCLPKHFWNRFAFLIQYKKAKSSDIEWLIKQYN